MSTDERVKLVDDVHAIRQPRDGEGHKVLRGILFRLLSRFHKPDMMGTRRKHKDMFIKMNRTYLYEGTCFLNVGTVFTHPYALSRKAWQQDGPHLILINFMETLGDDGDLLIFRST